ncbi:MAG: hypothetical protein KDA45_02565 [Planctomycetales bacterium]|nr:hypothetical protein [Planctomycetales bacterium]
MAGWLLFALASCFLAYVARLHEITHDAFHEMALVREALVLGELPQIDLFAYTPTVNPSVHHEWATGAVLYVATVGSGLGLLGLTLLKLTLMGLMWFCLYRVARLRGAHPYLFACFALITFPVLWVGFATVRAQLFTLVFIAAQLWMQELDWRGRRKWLLLWLPMLVAWLNLHAGFVVGLGLMGFHGLERVAHAWLRERRLLAALASTWHLFLAAPLAMLSLLINPYGWQYIPYLIRAIRMPRPLIAEWQPLWQTYAPLWTLVMFAVCMGLFLYAQRHTRLQRLRGAAFLAVCSYMALKHIRHGSIFAVVWMAYVPAWISRTSAGKAWVRFIDAHRLPAVRISQAVAAGCLLFATLHHFWRPTLPAQRVYSTGCYPTAAVDYLQHNHFAGKLLTPFHCGSFVSWEMYPAVKVSLDGRYEVAYQESVLPEHNHFFRGEGRWWTLLDRYAPDAALVHRQAAVCELLLTVLGQDSSAKSKPSKLAGWRVVYEDDSYVLIAPQNSHLPYVDRRGQALPDRAWAAFSAAHAHWNRRPPSSLAQR